MADILVVDDKIGIRELLSEILGDAGHAVTVAENAQQAHEARLACAPDLVLLDVWIPGTDGVTLLKEWKHGGLLTMPVIMMSGHATIDIAVEATHFGAYMFLEKPITLQKLLKAVQQGLSRTHEPSHPVTTSRDRIASVVDLMDGTRPTPVFSNGAHVNVIPLNPTSVDWHEPGIDRIERFHRALVERGVNATVRHNRGRDIDAACGQLAAKAPAPV